MTADEPAPRQTVSERVTVGLIPNAVRDLAALQAATGLSKTDIINRAVSLYALVNGEMVAGRELLVRDRQTGEVEQIRIL